jgi:hypothetical protein
LSGRGHVLCQVQIRAKSRRDSRIPHELDGKF